MMKLYMLKPIKQDAGPFYGYDVVTAMIVRAKSAAIARNVASRYAQDEAQRIGVNPWLHQQYTTCEELTTEGGELVLLQTRDG